MRDFGTHVITSVLAGVSLELTLFVSELTISASATGEFFKILEYNIHVNLTFMLSIIKKKVSVKI